MPSQNQHTIMPHADPPALQQQRPVDPIDAGKFRAGNAFDSVTADPCDSVHDRFLVVVVALPDDC